MRRVSLGCPRIVLAGLVALTARAGTNEPPSPRKLNQAEVARREQALRKEFQGNPDRLVRYGLWADRKARSVRLLAEATGLRGSDPCEFLLTAADSGKEYESIAVSFAKPSDLHEALAFIGMPSGQPVNAGRHRFWPKGERVVIHAEWEAGGLRRARAEALVFNPQSGKTLPESGFVFVGSTWKEDPTNRGARVYAADVWGPNSIASHYNDPETVLDVPRQASQTEVYSCHFPNPAWALGTNQMITFILEPEYKDGKLRARDMVLQVQPPEDPKTPWAVTNLVYRLRDAAAPAAEGPRRLVDALAAFEALVAAGHDPFVRVEFDDALPVSVLHEASAFLAGIDSERGIRIEPPPAGHPYYRAFLPNERFRDRASRTLQPWELRLTETAEGLKGQLRLEDEVLNRQTREWSTRIRHFEASAPEDIRAALSQKREDGETLLGLQTVFVFAPKTMLYRRLRPLLSAILETRPVVFVYPE